MTTAYDPISSCTCPKIESVACAKYLFQMDQPSTVGRVFKSTFCPLSIES